MKIQIKRFNKGNRNEEGIDMSVLRDGLIDFENAAVWVGSRTATSISMEISPRDVVIYDGVDVVWSGSLDQLGGAIRRLNLFDKLESEFKQKGTAEAVAKVRADNGTEEVR